MLPGWSWDACRDVVSVRRRQYDTDSHRIAAPPYTCIYKTRGVCTQPAGAVQWRANSELHARQLLQVQLEKKEEKILTQFAMRKGRNQRRSTWNFCNNMCTEKKVSVQSVEESALGKKAKKKSMFVRPAIETGHWVIFDISGMKSACFFPLKAFFPPDTKRWNAALYLANCTCLWAPWTYNASGVNWTLFFGVVHWSGNVNNLEAMLFWNVKGGSVKICTLCHTETRCVKSSEEKKSQMHSVCPRL